MNRSKYIVLVSFCVVAVALFVGCVKDKGKLPIETKTPPPTPVVGECDTVTFAKHIKPLMDANCGTATGCHVGSAPSGGVLLVDYSQVKDRAEAGRIKARVFDENPSVMPQSGPLTAAQKKLLNCWLTNGYKP